MVAQWLNCPKMNHEEWLNWRREGIGSSDASSIMEVSPWTTPYQKWQEKVIGLKKPSNPAKEWGKTMEEPARREFERLMNTNVLPRNVENKKTQWLRASLDGLSLDGDVLVEIKCPNKDDHFVALNKKVPEKYYPQCQHQLAVTGLPGMYYFSFDGLKGTVVEVARDQKYIEEQLFPKEELFWTSVITVTPPALTDRDKTSMENNKEWSKVSKKWQEANKSLKQYESEENLLRNQLIALANGRSAEGKGVSLTRSFTKGSINYSTAIQHYIDTLRALYPDITIGDIELEIFRKDPFIKWTARAM
jgi:putative phage-type endonuclease